MPFYGIGRGLPKETYLAKDKINLLEIRIDTARN